MDKPFLGGIVVALAIIVAGGAMVMAPNLQSPAVKVAALAGEDAERARRLLHQFSDNEERVAVLLDAMKLAGVDPQLKAEDVQRLLEEEAGRSAVEEQDARLKETLRAVAGQAGELEERYLRASYGAKWQDHLESSPTGLGNNVNQMGSALQAGLKERDRLLAENGKLLQQAQQAAESALGQSLGDASASAEVEPNRLSGVIFYHQGESQRRVADGLRRRAGQFLNRLVSLGVEARGLRQERELTSSSQVDARITEAEAASSAAQSNLTKAKSDAEGLEGRLAELKARIGVLHSNADAARGEMERLEAAGARLDHAGGLNEFAGQYGELAVRYRESLSEAHRLETGALRNARIDTSGDWVRGAYVPASAGTEITPDAGQPGLERELALARLVVAEAEASVAASKAQVDRLKALRDEYQERAAAAEAKLAKLAEAAQAAYGEFERIAAEAEIAEEAGVKCYTKAISAFNQAARAALERVGAAETAIGTLSEPAKARAAASLVVEQNWLEQQIKTNAADAQLRLGALHHDVWTDDERIAKSLAELPETLALKEVSAAAWTEKASAAKSAGIEILQKAYDSIQNARGPLKGHWTLAAEAAGAANLLAAFGEEAMRDVAIAAYEGVVAEGADKPYLQSYVDRLNAMKSAKTP